MQLINYKKMKYSSKRKRKLLYREKFENYEIFIMNLGTHPTAYIKVPETHPFYGKDYNEVEIEDIEVHGGITYCDDHLFISDTEEVNGWFIGWDYAHAGDFFKTDYEPLRGFRGDDKKWTTEEIIAECLIVIAQLRVVEKISSNCCEN